VAIFSGRAWQIQDNEICSSFIALAAFIFGSVAIAQSERP
jgi:hypothetical protein